MESLIIRIRLTLENLEIEIELEPPEPAFKKRTVSLPLTCANCR
jgi:hypothetical protein